MNNVVIVDYGIGNIKSVQRGLEKVGASVVLSSDPQVIANAGRLVLPGVGAFEDGMKGLKEAGLIDAIHEFVQTGNPLLGICLGMQMLLGQSEEYGCHEGLGLIQGSVKAISQYEGDQFTRKIPHIGWSALEIAGPHCEWGNTCLANIERGEYFYFVHSFMAQPENNLDVLAVCEYHGLPVTAVINHNNVTGMQFHPEKSGGAGLKILQNFVSL